MTIGILTPNGLIDAPYDAETLADAAKHEPEGVYTTSCTFKRTHALLLDAHLDRMEQSARLEGIPLQLDRNALRAALRVLIDQSGYTNARFRITVPRSDPTRLVITLEPFSGIPDELREQGVKVATVSIERHNPAAKTNEWMIQRSQVEPRAGVYEHLITNDASDILEGFSSNFYAIWHGVLYTAPENVVLSGISRQIVLKVAPNILPVEMKPIRSANTCVIDEAFLTSSSRGVIPIIQIDDQPIGNGKPGSNTQQITQLYNAWVEAHLELI